MSPNPPRRGRPPKFVNDDDGRPIIGLSATKVGNRFRYYATYSTPRIWLGTDRDVAVMRFRAWEAKRTKSTIPLAHERTALAHFWGDAEDAPLHRVVRKQTVRIDDGEFWRAVRERLLADPKRAAEKTGIRELGYLTELERPIPPYSLTKCGDDYHAAKEHEIHPEQFRNSKTWWKEFCDIVTVETVNDLTHDVLIAYANEIKRKQKQKSPKTGKPRGDSYTRNRFMTVRTILNFAHDAQKITPETLTKLKRAWKLPLKAPRQPKGKKFIITTDELNALLDNADEFMRAVVLLCLNAAFYPVDLAIEWHHVNLTEGTMFYPRTKVDEGERAAVLWKRTIKALRAIRPKNAKGPIFIVRGKPINRRALWSRFVALRDAAGLKRKIRPEDLRNSGATHAARNSPPMVYEAFMGRSQGLEEGYLERNPFFVADACKAIEKFYFKKG